MKQEIKEKFNEKKEKAKEFIYEHRGTFGYIAGAAVMGTFMTLARRLEDQNMEPRYQSTAFGWDITSNPDRPYCIQQRLYHSANDRDNDKTVETHASFYTAKAWKNMMDKGMELWLRHDGPEDIEE